MGREIDARGLDCPQPVLNTKKSLEEIEEGTIKVIVDNTIARDNVKRFAESQGCSVEIEEKGGNFYLKVVKDRLCEMERKPESAGGERVILICTDTLGTGDGKLGEILMRAFLNTMADAEPRPGKLIFMNNGVKLAVEGSEMLDALEALEGRGVEIFSCGTCLDYYDLKDNLRVGGVTNMFDMVNSIMNATKVIGL